MTAKQWRVTLLAAALAAGCAAEGERTAGEAGSAGVLGGGDDRAFDVAKDPPFSTNTHFAAGQLAESQGNLNGAVEQYRQALALDEAHVQTLYRLGVLYARMRQHEQAIETWGRYVKATGGDATGYSNLGFAHELAGQATQAEAAYLAEIAADAKNQPCRVNYGLMLARAGQMASAEQQLGAVLGPAEVQYNLASVLEQQGRREEAVRRYRRALEIDPGFDWARSRLAGLE